MKTLKLIISEFLKKSYIFIFGIAFILFLIIGFLLISIPEDVNKNQNIKSDIIFKYEDDKINIEKIKEVYNFNEEEMNAYVLLREKQNEFEKFCAENIKKISSTKNRIIFQKFKEDSQILIALSVMEKVDFISLQKAISKNKWYEKILEELIFTPEEKEFKMLKNTKNETIKLSYEALIEKDKKNIYNKLLKLYDIEEEYNSGLIKYYEELIKKEEIKEYRNDEKIKVLTKQIEDLNNEISKSDSPKEIAKLQKQLNEAQLEIGKEENKSGPNEAEINAYKDKIVLIKSNFKNYIVKKNILDMKKLNIDLDKNDIRIDIIDKKNTINFVRKQSKDKLTKKEFIKENGIPEELADEAYKDYIDKNKIIDKSEEIDEKKYEYIITNNLDVNPKKNKDNIDSAIQGCMFVIIIISTLIITFVYVDEVERGTIKLTLTRPAKRYKILLSKYFTVIIILILLSLIAMCATCITTKVKGYNMNEILLNYNLETDVVTPINIVKYIVIKNVLVIFTGILIVSVIFLVTVLIPNRIFLILFGFFIAMLNLLPTLIEGSFNKVLIFNMSSMYTYLEKKEIEFAINTGHVYSYKFIVLLTISISLLLLILTTIIFKIRDVKNKN